MSKIKKFRCFTFMTGSFLLIVVFSMKVAILEDIFREKKNSLKFMSTPFSWYIQLAFISFLLKTLVGA
jgi:hypothetical protein